MKFEVGDTVVGNSKNGHGITGPGTKITVSRVNGTTFNGVVESHKNPKEVGSLFEGLVSDWFDLEDDLDNNNNNWERENTPQLYQPGQYVLIYRGKYSDTKGTLLGYTNFDGDGWECEVLTHDYETIKIFEDDLDDVPTSSAHFTSAWDVPKDLKTWGRTREEVIVTPAHKKESVKATAYIMSQTGTVLTSIRRRRRAPLQVQSEYKLKA